MKDGSEREMVKGIDTIWLSKRDFGTTNWKRRDVIGKVQALRYKLAVLIVCQGYYC